MPPIDRLPKCFTLSLQSHHCCYTKTAMLQMKLVAEVQMLIIY